MRKIQHDPPCGNQACAISSGIHDGLTFGSGYLDDYGYWSRPCVTCARAYEKNHPGCEPCWPFEKEESKS